MITPAQRAQRSAAGKRSGGVRSGRAPSEDGAAPTISGQLPATSDPDVDKQIAAYVAIVGDPTGWTEVKALEQTRAEIYRTRAAARADDIERHALFTRDQIRTRDEWLATTLKDSLRGVADLAARYAPPEQKQAAQVDAQRWADGVLTAVADAVKNQGSKS